MIQLKNKQLSPCSSALSKHIVPFMVLIPNGTSGRNKHLRNPSDALQKHVEHWEIVHGNLETMMTFLFNSFEWTPGLAKGWNGVEQMFNKQAKGVPPNWGRSPFFQGKGLVASLWTARFTDGKFFYQNFWPFDWRRARAGASASLSFQHQRAEFGPKSSWHRRRRCVSTATGLPPYDRSAPRRRGECRPPCPERAVQRIRRQNMQKYPKWHDGDMTVTWRWHDVDMRVTW